MHVLLALLMVAATAGSQEITVYAPGNGVSLPQATKQVRAEYTQEAMQNRIEGKVGTVSESLDSVHGLDKNAVTAMKQWEFKPGTKDGKPVAVRVSVSITFALK